MATILTIAIIAGIAYAVYAFASKEDADGGRGGSKPNDDIGTDHK